jgi:IS5 family transposase
MLRKLVLEAKACGVELRQSYDRLGKRALMMQGRYSHARQMRRSRRETKKLKTYLGRVVRDMERKLADPGDKVKALLELAHRLLNQKREDSHKLYSLHAPETECIAKGKVHKKYEFGCKVSIVTTSKKSWVVGIDAVHGNPYDGHTLKQAINQMKTVTGKKPDQVFVDKGYKGAKHHPEGMDVFLSGSRGLSRSLKSWLKRRSAIEPVIGHTKGDHRMDRNHLLGKEGDRVNAMLAGSAFNLGKLIRAFFLLIFGRDILDEECGKISGTTLRPLAFVV